MLPSAVNRSGAVSPATRARPSIAAVTIPRLAAGSTTRTIVAVREAPSASDASRSDRGTASRNSSALRVMIGIIITPSATPPASVENCFIGRTMRV